MGTLYYGAARTPIRIDDHTLTHFKIMATSKMRRGEGFLLSWTDDTDAGAGRNSVWIHAGSDMHYKFDEAAPMPLETEVLELMARQAAGTRGIELKDATLVHTPDASPTSIEPSA